jgi:hypothetical protein
MEKRQNSWLYRAVELWIMQCFVNWNHKLETRRNGILLLHHLVRRKNVCSRTTVRCLNINKPQLEFDFGTLYMSCSLIKSVLSIISLCPQGWEEYCTVSADPTRTAGFSSLSVRRWSWGCRRFRTRHWGYSNGCTSTGLWVSGERFAHPVCRYECNRTQKIPEKV